jgi:C_GCAxxG_C_C family probable redox protein
MLSMLDKTGLTEAQSTAVAEGFGGGVRCGEICGAISGAVMVAGLAVNAKTREEKMKVSALTKEITGTFRDRYGVIRCCELKGNGVSCDELIAFGAETAEKLVK